MNGAHLSEFNVTLEIPIAWGDMDALGHVNNTRKPLTYPDTVTVGARTIEVTEDRFTHQYRIMNSKGELVADGGGVVVAYDYTIGTKGALPGDVRNRIRDLDGI